MCVTQFREYCKASRFKANFDNILELDKKNKNFDVGVLLKYKNQVDHYYVTDLLKMNKLAKNNNEYAIKHLKKIN